MITQAQARLLCESLELFEALHNQEQMDLMDRERPELAEAYYALHRIAVGADELGADGGNGEAAKEERCYFRVES
jgi:hypothetical protein